MQGNNQYNPTPENNWQNSFQPPPPPPPKDVKPLISMILGIVGIVIGCCCPIAGIGLGVAAVIIAGICYSQNLETNKGFYLAGLITGIAAIVLHIINMILGVVLGMSGFYDSLYSMF